jgi:hypothetical protein
MSANFTMKTERKNGSLYVIPSGDFDGNSAWELLNLIEEQFTGSGNVIIETERLQRLYPFGCQLFRSRFGLACRLPAKRLFLKGRKGLELAPGGSRVVLHRKAS